MKKGRNFEENFRKSIDRDLPELFFYRFKDGTATWDKNSTTTRFQSHNIADCMIFYKTNLFIFELKSHKGKSLPFNCIRNTQYEEMFNASKKQHVYPFIIIFFSEIEECYAINIKEITKFKMSTDRKSIPLEFCKEKGHKINLTKLITNYRFDILSFLNNF